MEENKPAEIKTNVSSKKVLKSILIVGLGNLFTLAAGILTGLFIPKIMTVTDYGFYKSFTLYLQYIGLLHFGFIDGIYLIYAGLNYDDLDKKDFRSFTRFFILFEIIVALIGLLIVFFAFDNQYRFIFSFVAIDMVIANVAMYFEYISQITGKFKLLSLRNIIKSVLTVFSVAGLVLLYFLYGYSTPFYLYTMIVVSIHALLTIWYMITYRDLVFGEANSIRSNKRKILKLFKVGIPLLISNFIVSAIMIVDQQFVNLFYSKEDYAIYAFAYNLVALVTVAINAISTVLYPTINKMDDSTVKENYSKLNSYVMMFVSGCLFAYFPITLIVNYFLGDYIKSLSYFGIIFPSLVITSAISIVKYNCYKKYQMVSNYLIKAAIILILAIVLDYVAFKVFNTLEAISFVSVCVMLGWYILAEEYFVRAHKVKWLKNFIYMLGIIIGFYALIYNVENIYIAGSIYIAFYLALTLVLYFKELSALVKNLKRKKE